MNDDFTPGPWQSAEETAGQAIRIRTVGTIDSSTTLALVLVPFAGTEAEPVPGPTTDAVAGLARRHAMYVICPIREQAGTFADSIKLWSAA